jgi:trk system potassium uptake protein TrkH
MPGLAETKSPRGRFRFNVNIGSVLFLLGRLLLTLALALLIPALVGQYLNEDARWSFYVAAGIAGALGLFLERYFHESDEFDFGRREAFVLVSSAWLVGTIVGALPYVLENGIAFAVNALFESASGFTTTGASIFTDVESLPGAVLLWRALTQWIGGMGIIVLGIAILPKLAVGGMELLGAEAPGPMQEKLTPRIAQTAKALWGIYVILTVAEIGILLALGLDPLDAVAHALASMATGGFSTKNASISAFASPAVEWTITLFMILAGASFAVHYQWLRGKFGVLKSNPELRLYLGILMMGTAVVFLDLMHARTTSSPFEALSLSAFQVVSVVTTTGFATANYDAWPQLSRVLLFLLMFTGGCAGSTGGSVKIVRLYIVFKKIAVDLKRMLQPRAVLPVRLGGRGIPDDVVSSVTTFFVLFMMLFVLGGVALTIFGVDPLTAFTASAACLGNIGPGFGGVGPTMTYAGLPAAAKVVLAVLMIVGRLELYTVMVIFFFRRLA